MTSNQLEAYPEYLYRDDLPKDGEKLSDYVTRAEAICMRARFGLYLRSIIIL